MADVVLPAPPVVAPTPTPTPPPSRPAAARVAPATVETAAPSVSEPLSLTSLLVVHQHRFGSCRGHLVVSRDGVAYIPEGQEDKDGFRLKYTQFLDEVSGGSLRITSNDRDYRFRVAVPSGSEREQLERLTAAIARFR